MIGFASSCGACKFLRRKCTNECVFAPYFCHEQGANHFAAVHKVFGASNVSKLLSHLPVHNRSEAAITISYEALARMRDPVYGCVAHIYALQQQVANLHEEIEFLETQVANLANDVSHQSCQETNETKNWFSSSSQQEAINVQHYLNQQPAQPSHTMNATGDLGHTDEMNVQLPPMNLLEDQNLFYDFTDGTNYLERFAMEMEQEISPSGPWLGNVTYAEY